MFVCRERQRHAIFRVFQHITYKRITVENPPTTEIFVYAALHKTAFPVCQVSILVASGSFVFCFSKAASTHRLVAHFTAKHNLLRYCTASPIFPFPAKRPPEYRKQSTSYSITKLYVIEFFR